MDEADILDRLRHLEQDSAVADQKIHTLEEEVSSLKSDRARVVWGVFGALGTFILAWVTVKFVGGDE